MNSRIRGAKLEHKIVWLFIVSLNHVGRCGQLVMATYALKSKEVGKEKCFW